MVAALIESLKDSDQEVADRAAFALENIYERKNSYDLVRPLLEAEADPDPRISERIGAILAKKIHIDQ